VLDDISPLRQANASIVAEEAHLFTSRAAIRTRMDTPNAAATPSEKIRRRRGALLLFERRAKDPVKLELLDAQGKVIRAFTSEEKKKDAGSDEWEKDEAEEHIPAKLD